MTVEQAKQEIFLMNAIVKKLLTLSEEKRSRVINYLLTSVLEENDDAAEELRALSFCTAKLDKIGKKERYAIVKFMVDRFIPNRFGEEKQEEEIVLNELEEEV